MFMFLESLHTYSLVAYVVKKNGILNRLQNTLVGWGFSIAIVLIFAGLMYDDYGGEYHCWLQVRLLSEGTRKNQTKMSLSKFAVCRIFSRIFEGPPPCTIS